MIFIIFGKKKLMGWEKMRYAEIFKRLVSEIRRFNKEIRIFGDDLTPLNCTSSCVRMQVTERGKNEEEKV